jgi:hypothetical protein
MNTVKVDLNIAELGAVIEYNQKIIDSIPRDRLDVMTAAKHTLGVTLEKYQNVIGNYVGFTKTLGLNKIWVSLYKV